MDLKVLKKQNNSEDCIVCGLKNHSSLRTRFYELEGDIICGIFNTEDFHQSFPGRMHGGMISAVLDEVIGRAVMIKNPEQWGVTGELTVRYLKPTPLSTKLKAFGKIVKENSRLFKGVGYIEDNEGNVLATAEATYFKMDLNKISVEPLGNNWFYENEIIPDTISTNNIDTLSKLEQKMQK